MSDRIEKSIEIAAPVERVWRALTDHVEFGKWFGVALEGPFSVGEPSRGQMTVPGHEDMKWDADIVAMEPPRRFVYRWRPYAIDPKVDYSGEPQTTIEFVLTPAGQGTRIVVTESGFDAVPAHRRDEAYRMHEKGWVAQLQNIKAHVEA